MSEEKELPRGWVETFISSIAVINPRLDTSLIPNFTLVSFIPMAAVEAGTGRIDTSAQRKLEDVKRGYTAFREGDVLFAKITPCMENGKSAVARSLSSGIGFGSTEFHVLRPTAGIDPQLLYYYVSQEAFRQTARAFMTGSAGQLRVPASFLADVSYPLAPLSEQQRIVASIEQQFSRLDAGVTALRQAKEKLKRYRAAVLKAAVEGKLTETWRAEHLTTEPASKLLERILAERRAKWEADLRSKGKDPAKLRYVEPKGPEVEDLPELPEGWCWATVEQVGDTDANEQVVLTGPFGSNLGREDFIDSGVPVLTIGCLTEKGLSLEKAFYISEEKANDLERYRVKVGDLLFSRMASVGRADLVTTGLEGAIINYHLMRLRLAGAVIDSNYFITYVRGSQAVFDYIKEVNHGVTRDGINTNQLLALPVALPPLPEQEQIVSEVEQRLSVVSQLEAAVEANLKRAERLRQSILKEAFAGRLVPQDPNDEPASVLLERIRGERNGRKNGKVDKKAVENVVLEEPMNIDVEGMQQAGLWEGVGG